MWEKRKAVLITNNSKVIEKYKDEVQVIEEDSYEAVLIKTRDLVNTGYELLTHPQASSLKPNQTPIRSILLYKESGGDQMRSVLLMEKCIEVYRQWQEISKTPEHYEENVENDFRTIDLSVVDNIMQRIG